MLGTNWSTCVSASTTTAQHPEDVWVNDRQVWPRQRAQELSKEYSGIDGVVASMVAVRNNLLEQITIGELAICELTNKDSMA